MLDAGLVPNTLYYGDNLDVLRKHIAAESIDLIYLDPPFNSNRSYNVLFKAHCGEESQAQIEAFDDSWHWSQQTEDHYSALVAGVAPIKVGEAIEAMHDLVGPNDVLANLVMITARLVELHRVLKLTGSLYLRCDPNASHYLKIMLDPIFGPISFRSEIIWKRYGSHNDAKNNFGAVNDTILFYSRTPAATFNQQYSKHDPDYVERSYRHADTDGRKWRVQNLTSPNPRPNLTYPYTALKGVTYHSRPNGWKCTPQHMRELD